MATFFSSYWVSGLMVVWLIAIWFHLNHGFWSALQTLGLDNSRWFPRLKVIGLIVTTLILLTFLVVVVYFNLIYNGPASMLQAPQTQQVVEQAAQTVTAMLR